MSSGDEGLFLSLTRPPGVSIIAPAEWCEDGGIGIGAGSRIQSRMRGMGVRVPLLALLLEKTGEMGGGNRAVRQGRDHGHCAGGILSEFARGTAPLESVRCREVPCRASEDGRSQPQRSSRQKQARNLSLCRPHSISPKHCGLTRSTCPRHVRQVLRLGDMTETDQGETRSLRCMGHWTLSMAQASTSSTLGRTRRTALRMRLARWSASIKDVVLDATVRCVYLQALTLNSKNAFFEFRFRIVLISTWWNPSSCNMSL